MILFLDTTTDQYLLALCSSEGRFLRRKVLQRDERIGDRVFRAIAALLKGKRITMVVAIVGPGRFSGIRHGIAIANTLAFVWNIPIVGIEKKIGENMKGLLRRALRQKTSSFLIPRYGQEPNITMNPSTKAR